MKTTNQLLSLLCILTLSACQAGKISGQNLNQSSGNANSAVIDLGNLNSGQVLNVQSNPIPTSDLPTDGSAETLNQSSVEKEVLWVMWKALSLISSDAHAIAAPQIPIGNQGNPAPDSFQFYSASDLSAKLLQVLGQAQFDAYQDQYSNYLSAFAANASTPAPTELLRPVTLSFTSNNQKVSSITTTLLMLLSSHTSVITFGVKAYIGKGLIVAASTAVTEAPLANLTGAALIKIGASTIKVIGGKVGTVLNRNIATITLSASNTFTINTSPTSLSTSASLAGVVSKVVDSAVAASAGVTGVYIGNYVLIANLNSLGKITGYSFLKYSTGVFTSYAGTCASLVSYFPGYSCNTISTSTGTTTSTNL